GGKTGTPRWARCGWIPGAAAFMVTAAAATGSVDALGAATAAAVDIAGAGPFAVRSSAAAEDLPDASYAGLYATSRRRPIRVDDRDPGLHDFGLPRRGSPATAQPVTTPTGHPISADRGMAGAGAADDRYGGHRRALHRRPDHRGP
ncbi:MAG TPA: PEP/pyruvate-binding domain-containing protein, partial [Nakamurella sp.]